jgi:hypothetical protein
LKGPHLTGPMGKIGKAIAVGVTGGGGGSGVETDPVFTAWDKSTGISITASQTTDFDTAVSLNADVIDGVTAHGWGDHSLAGYLTTLSGALLATGATTGATSQAQTFTNGVITGKIYPSADSVTAIQINKADGTTNVLNVDTTNGRVGIGTTAPTSKLHLAAGTATAETAPIKLTSGTLMTNPEAGAIEFLTDTFYATITTGPARKGIVTDNGTRLTSGYIPCATTNGRLQNLTPQAHIADLKEDYTTGDLDTEAEIIAAINATNEKFNVILVKLEALHILNPY